MNPTAIHATNLRTFEHLDLELPAGCVVIGGENGAGKSTILNAIDVALFCGRGELAALLALGEDELTLELEFEHAGELYRVRRMYSAKGRGKTTLDLEATDGPLGDWRPLTRETADQTQHLLEKILGLSRTTFRASSFLAQGDGAAFTDAQPRDRKAILAEILGLDIWDRLLEQTRRDLRAAEDSTLVARGRLSTLDDEIAAAAPLDQELADARTALADAVARHDAAQHRLEDAQRAHEANAAAVERVRAAEAAHVAAAAARERARDDYAAAVEAGHTRVTRQAELDEISGTADSLDDLAASVEAAQIVQGRLRERALHLEEAARIDQQRDRVAGDCDRLYREATELAAKAEHLDSHIGEAGDCDRCGQKLGAEAAARAAASYRAEAQHEQEQAAALQQEAATLQQQIDELHAKAHAVAGSGETVAETDALIARLQSKLVAARSARERRAALAEQIRQLSDLAARSDELAVVFEQADQAVQQASSALAAARAQVADDEQLRAAVAHARSALDAAQSSASAGHARVTRLEAALERREAAQAERETIREELASTQRTIDVLKLAERAFGRDGIPALIVENAAIPQLELEANRILGELGGATAGCRIELRTQRAQKTTETLRETLDIIIVTPTGERPYETFSGGERTRLNLALRISLARLLAHRRGAESRLLAIDEPDGLDAQGMDALAGILAGLAGDFDRILVVSHQPQLATSFDQGIVIVKDGDRSRIATDLPALVAA